MLVKTILNYYWTHPHAVFLQYDTHHLKKSFKSKRCWFQKRARFANILPILSVLEMFTCFPKSEPYRPYAWGV